MLILLPEPLTTPEYDALGLNIESFESIGVRRLHSTFQLVLHKHFDGRFQIDSSLYFVLANLESRERCDDLFQAIVSALTKKDKVFHIGKYLKQQNTDSQNKKDAGYL